MLKGRKRPSSASHQSLVPTVVEVGTVPFYLGTKLDYSGSRRTTTMPGRKPTKKELAKMKVMNESGISPTAIANQMGKGHGTIIKYLNSEVYNDPSIKKLVTKIRENETNDLYILGAKGRSRLHEMLDDGKKLQMIPTIALVDRTFQQRRLLEGKSTSNVNTITHLLEQNEAALRSESKQDDNGQQQEQS